LLLPSASDRAGVRTITILFKTLSASAYGIDAYLVEVEVDVGVSGESWQKIGTRIYAT
jgi:DNA repair ATPase RecN